MRRVREFTAFEALVHTVVKRLGETFPGVRLAETLANKIRSNGFQEERRNAGK